MVNGSSNKRCKSLIKLSHFRVLSHFSFSHLFLSAALSVSKLHFTIVFVCGVWVKGDIFRFHRPSWSTTYCVSCLRCEIMPSQKRDHLLFANAFLAFVVYGWVNAKRWMNESLPALKCIPFSLQNPFLTSQFPLAKCTKIKAFVCNVCEWKGSEMRKK